MSNPNSQRIVSFAVYKGEIRPNELLKLMKHKKSKDELNKKIWKLVQFDNVEAMDFLFSSGYKIDVLNTDGQTAIHIAMLQQSFRILTMDSIFSKCETKLNYTDNFGLSHLHIACAIGNLKVVKTFVEKGENINEICHSHRTFENFTPLHFAAMYERDEVVKYLLRKGAKTDVVDNLGLTPLHLACIGYENTEDILPSEILKILENSEYHCVKVVELLAKHKKGINIKDKNGCTPLLHIFNNRLCQTFDDTYYDDRSIYDVKAAMNKSRNRQLKKLEILLKNGADVSITNDEGCTVLHWAIYSLKITRSPTVCTVTCFDDKLVAKMIRMILKKGANVNAKNRRQKHTPLELAVRFLSADLIKVFLEFGANISDEFFNNSDENDFQYANIRPCLRAVENFIDIADIFSDKGKPFSLSDNLIALKFLLHWGDKCTFENTKNAEDTLLNLLHYGTPEAIARNYKKIHYSGNCRRLLSELSNFLSVMELANIFVDKQTKSLDKVLDINGEQFMKEIELMKNVNIHNSITLHTVLTLHPNKIYHHLKTGNYKKITRADDFNEQYFWYGEAIKGHFAKTLTRRYVLESAKNFFRYLIGCYLPDICCIMVLEFLTTEELYNVCVAAMIKSNKN